MAPGQIARKDYEYVRKGTANIYCIVEPKTGHHLTHATRDRKAPRFAAALQRIARRYRTATTIHLIMDNLNLPGANALIRALGATHGAALLFVRLMDPPWQVRNPLIVLHLVRNTARLDHLDEIAAAFVADREVLIRPYLPWLPSAARDGRRTGAIRTARWTSR